MQRSLTGPSSYQPFTDSTPDIQVAQLSSVQGVVANLTRHPAKVYQSKPFRKQIPQSPFLGSNQPATTFKGIKTITCADTENQLSLPHIKHIATNDAAPTIQIHVTSLNGSNDIEMLLDCGSDTCRELLIPLGEHDDGIHLQELHHKQ